MEARGCNVKIDDIKDGTRIFAWKGQEKIKPFKLEFKELSKATQIKKAIREAGFMGRRSLSKHGLYKPSGNKRVDKESRKKMPDTFVNESTTKAQRDEIREKNRYKNSQTYKDKVDYQKFAKECVIDFSKYHILPNGDIELLPQQEPKKTQKGTAAPTTAAAAGATAASVDTNGTTTAHKARRYPSSNEMCRGFLAGKCRYSPNCRFSHDKSLSMSKKETAEKLKEKEEATKEQASIRSRKMR
jgi:hypothetical protein